VTELEREVLPYLKHVQVVRTAKCSCPKDSWAPCGSQYEGRYDPDCPDHKGPMPDKVTHYVLACPRPAPEAVIVRW
jgi:hypothetical protein